MSVPGYVVRERRLVFETSLFSVFSDTLVDDHDDVMAPNYLVVGPKNRTPERVTGIVVVPYVEDKVGLILVFRHAVGQSGWEVPRGFVDEGETPAVAALRELAEEAGLSCSPGNLIDMGCIAPDPGILDARIQCFIARDCSVSIGRREVELGHSEFRLFTASEIDQLMRGGGIQDSVSVASYFWSQSLENRERRG